jgi:hypothetical protein
MAGKLESYETKSLNGVLSFWTPSLQAFKPPGIPAFWLKSSDVI